MEYRDAPSTWTAYRRFALTSRPGLKSCDDFPRIEANWRGVKVKPELLNRYRQCCSVENEPGLPIHYPHVLASPLHLNILTQPEFPLKLLGSLHLRNHAIRYRIIDPQEPLDMFAALKEARFRPQGIEFDLDTELKVGEELVWAERSTFLVRKKLKDESPPSPLAEVFPWSDESEEVDQFKVPSGAGKQFARITGDYNPIHVSKILARIFGFRRDLVHGMWGVAHGTSSSDELCHSGPIRADISFKGPLFMESEVLVRATTCSSGTSLRLFCGEEPRPAVLVVVRQVDGQSKPSEAPSC